MLWEGKSGEERNLNGCRILIVSDDQIAGAMEAHLQSWGYRMTR